MYCLAQVEMSEYSVNISLGYGLAESRCWKLYEFSKINSLISIGIVIVQDSQYKLVLSTKSKTDECVFKFDWVNDSTFVYVKDIECFLELKNFFQYNCWSDVVLNLINFLNFWLLGLNFDWVLLIDGDWLFIHLSMMLYLMFIKYPNKKLNLH